MGSIVRIAAITASAFIALSFMAFAADRSREGSDNQVRAVDGSVPRKASDDAIDRPAPPPEAERRREAIHSGAREFLDDGNDILAAPFSFVEAKNVWVARLVPAGLGLLVFGLGGLLLANFIPKPHRESRDWREATS